MKKTIIPSTIAAIFVLLTISLFNACADSDDYIYDEENHMEIAIEAKMMRSFDSTSVQKTADTISAGDSMIFSASVYPSKSIRIKDYYWEMDDAFFASEFSVRESISTSGHHKFVFVLVDFFGDTLRDTVNLWVSRQPILKATNFIPASGTQGLPPNKDIQFAWQTINPDTLQKTFYHFTLASILDNKHQEPDLIDTIISTPYFVSNKDLKPLSIYRWSVQAFNEYGLHSKEKITSEFSTKGVKDEAGVFGIISPSALDLYANIEVIVLDTNNKPTGLKTIVERTPTDNEFSLSPLSPGRYKITAIYKNGADFIADTLPITLSAGEVMKLDSLHLSDTIPPVIRTADGSDTLDFADSLSFIIQDGSGSSIPQNTVIYLGDRKITSYRENGNTITFATTSEDRTWITQLVTIIAQDASGNKAKKDFYVRNSEPWILTNNDTTISSQGGITMILQDKNPYGFIPKSYIINPHNDTKGIISSSPENFPNGLQIDFGASSFQIGPNIIIDSVIYENSFVQTKSWILTINAPPEMSFSNCIDPCDSTSFAGTSADFDWAPALDPENDSLLYRIVYTKTKNENDESFFVYPMEFSKKTSATLRNLPVGDIYWWVEAKDPYGGISEIWTQRAHLKIYDDNGTTDNAEGGNEE